MRFRFLTVRPAACACPLCRAARAPRRPRFGRPRPHHLYLIDLSRARHPSGNNEKAPGLAPRVWPRDLTIVVGARPPAQR